MELTLDSELQLFLLQLLLAGRRTRVNTSVLGLQRADDQSAI